MNARLDLGLENILKNVSKETRKVFSNNDLNNPLFASSWSDEDVSSFYLDCLKSWLGDAKFSSNLFKRIYSLLNISLGVGTFKNYSDELLELSKIEPIPSNISEVADEVSKKNLKHCQLLTKDTSSDGVFLKGPYIFKVYSDKFMVDDEIEVLEKLNSFQPLAGKTQILLNDFFFKFFQIYSKGKDKDLSDVLSFLDVNFNRVRYGNKYVVGSMLVSSNLSNSIIVKYFLNNYNFIKNSGIDILECNSHLNLFNLFNDKINILKETKLPYALRNYEDNEFVQRLNTLSILHSSLENGFNEKFDELEKSFRTKYHDFSFEEVKGKFGVFAKKYFSNELGNIYSDVSKRQKKLFEKRKLDESLVFCNGDAKWDNFLDFGRVLIDFGSYKFSTEYKDVAKSLLDLEDIANFDIVNSYLDVYEFLRENNNFSVIEPSEEFKRNVYENILLESMRTLYYKPDNKKVVKHMKKIVEVYSNYIKNNYSFK
ncbi:hypothetical protein KY334_01840 [Candidatus Woesearchaeota archaeon]|nr:hypothetical protein [Candidatus Woesearchaeota archaeon]